jgi:hypothetical protein
MLQLYNLSVVDSPLPQYPVKNLFLATLDFEINHLHDDKVSIPEKVLPFR